jgi:hypothetical protein
MMARDKNHRRNAPINYAAHFLSGLLSHNERQKQSWFEPTLDLPPLRMAAAETCRAVMAVIGA